jgi:polyhydroxyalkanoate synthase
VRRSPLRYYILDLTAERSYIRWCVEQGISVFVVSWKSADESMGDVVWDDYIAAQIEAIDTIRDLLDVNSVHAIGYCVAGTTLAGDAVDIGSAWRGGQGEGRDLLYRSGRFHLCGRFAQFRRRRPKFP